MPRGRRGAQEEQKKAKVNERRTHLYEIERRTQSDCSLMSSARDAIYTK
jgi:hypothetical protein